MAAIMKWLRNGIKMKDLYIKIGTSFKIQNRKSYMVNAGRLCLCGEVLIKDKRADKQKKNRNIFHTV
jgi:hypothetical protein